MQQLLVERHQGLGANTRLGLLRLDGLELACWVRLSVRLLHLREGRREALGELLVHRLDVVLGEYAVADKSAREHFARRRMALDDVVQPGLGERRLIRLVVPVPSVSDEVDQDILAELHPVLDRDPHGDDAGFGVVAVHVEHRHLEALRDVAGVVRAARVDGIGGEAHLVVGDDVQRATHAIAAEQREVHRLRDDTLARERRVAVHDKG